MYKFYEFNGYEYYALVKAKNEDEAKRYYEEVVSELEKHEQDLSPDIISLDEAIEKVKKAYFESEEERPEIINSMILDDKSDLDHCVILIDRSLI